MDYHDNMERSAEYLRLALPLMSKQSAALNPVSYAVWYDYVSGRNAELKSRIDELTRDGRTLDDQTTKELFRRHVAALDEALARRVSQGFQKIMADVSKSAAEAGSDAGQFGSALEKWSAGLAQTADADATDLSALLGQTRQMQNSISTLKNRLDESHSEIDRLRQEVVRARQESLADGLTGLTNRRGFDQALTECLSRQDEVLHAPSLLITDVDHFKRINDNYGHQAGDRVLQAFAQVAQAELRGSDRVVRWGGEEFLIFLPETDELQAVTCLERIRSAYATQEVYGLPAGYRLSFSAGVAPCRDTGDIDTSIERADGALYQAKQAGRARTRMAGTPLAAAASPAEPATFEPV